MLYTVHKSVIFLYSKFVINRSYMSTFASLSQNCIYKPSKHTTVLCVTHCSDISRSRTDRYTILKYSTISLFTSNSLRTQNQYSHMSTNNSRVINRFMEIPEGFSCLASRGGRPPKPSRFGYHVLEEESVKKYFCFAE